MRKSILILVFVVSFLLVFNSSCGKTEIELEWDLLEGNGSYSQQDDTSSIRLIGMLHFNQSRIVTDSLQAGISYWSFVVKEGEDLVFDLNISTYPLIIGDVFINQSGVEPLSLWVYIEPPNPIPGDIFNGRNPDNVEMYVQVIDENGTTYEGAITATFEFTRN